MESVCRLSTSVIRLSKSISKHSLRSFLHCAKCVFLAPSGSAKFIAFWCKKNRRATEQQRFGEAVAAWEMMLKLLPANDTRRAVIERSIAQAMQHLSPQESK